MGYILKKLIANIKNFGLKRALSKIEYIVIHYTANDGDTDEANAKYFKNNVVKSSAHYFVDDDSVTQSVEDNRVAWHCGGKRYSDYKKTGGAKFYGKCTNTNSLGIEMCDAVKDGKHNVSKKTLDNTIDLVKKKMKEYNIPADRVIRHFDVTGKVCPKYFVEDDKAWKEFKTKLTTNTKKDILVNFQ
jgi:N-acetylmuramoyl-L-alanine amidase CwlA